MKIIKIIAEIVYIATILFSFALSSLALYENKKLIAMSLCSIAGIMIGYRLFVFIYKRYLGG